MKYFFHPEAVFDRFEAAAHYKQQRQDLAQVYVNAFNETIQRILKYPERYKIEMLPDIRKLALDKFPYYIVYRQGHKGIEVLAVAHQSRRPNYWHNRIQTS